MNNLANNLIYLRKKIGLKQAEIQEKLGVKRNTWSNWENGVSEPSINDLIAVAHFFGISAGRLIDDDLSFDLTIDKLSSGDLKSKAPFIQSNNNTKRRTTNISEDEQLQMLMTMQRLINRYERIIEQFEITTANLSKEIDELKRH